ncbi:MAG TPA: hypothetical protein VKU90_07405 [Caulobacteraceae bacterium]|nr:hypothetical protein [Caulobacteraceae bacterium]
MSGRRIAAYTAIGRLDGACPNCAVDLPAWPTCSGACPHCAREIYVRRRPLDREWVLVAERELTRLELEWELYRERGGDQPLRPLLDESALEVERGHLRMRLGREPTEADAAAALISRRAFAHMRSLELGSFRDLNVAKAALADQQGKRNEALAGYLGACFLDLNGAHNPPRNAPGRIVAAATGFDAARAFLAHPVVKRLIQLIAVLDIDEDTLRDTFIGFCERYYQPFRAPRRPAEVWAPLAEVLFGQTEVAAQAA